MKDRLSVGHPIQHSSGKLFLLLFHLIYLLFFPSFSFVLPFFGAFWGFFLLSLSLSLHFSFFEFFVSFSLFLFGCSVSSPVLVFLFFLEGGGGRGRGRVARREEQIVDLRRDAHIKLGSFLLMKRLYLSGNEQHSIVSFVSFVSFVSLSSSIRPPPPSRPH